MLFIINIVLIKFIPVNENRSNTFLYTLSMTLNIVFKDRLFRKCL